MKDAHCKHSVQTVSPKIGGSYHCHECHSEVTQVGVVMVLVRQLRELQEEVAEMGGVLNKQGWRQCRYCESWTDFNSAWGGWHTERQGIGWVCSKCIVTLFNDESFDLSKEYFSTFNPKTSLGNVYYWIAAWACRTELVDCQAKEYKGLHAGWMEADAKYKAAFKEYRRRGAG